MDTRETKECSLPPPLTEDEISSVVDGHPSRGARVHLRRCAFCTTHVAEARRVESSFAQALHRFDCPTAQRLVDYTMSLLDDAEARASSLHLEGCARCSSEVSELRAFLQSAALDERAAAEVLESPAIVQRRARLPRLSVGEIIARLLPRALGLAYRGASTGREPVVAEVDDTVITLDVQPAASGGVQVIGMLAALDSEIWAGAVALLWMEGKVRAAAPLDENGGFAFGSLPIGLATLRITPEHGSTIVFADIQLN